MHVGLTMFPTDYSIPPHDLAVAAERARLQFIVVIVAGAQYTFPPVANRRGPADGGCRSIITIATIRSSRGPLPPAVTRTSRACDGDLSCRRARSNPHRQGGIDRRPAFLGPVHFRRWRGLERGGDGQSRHCVCNPLQADG